MTSSTHMSTLEKLIAQFERFPGVGARQARRFAFHILTLNERDATELASHITSLKSAVTTCDRCKRFITDEHVRRSECAICGDPTRDKTRLLIVERDSDVQSVERAGSYNGLYFVLGGTVPLLEHDTDTRVRSGALKSRVAVGTRDEGLCELILAFSVNPEGENTERYIQSLLSEHIETNNITVSHLGRGLSTGSELEYADPETLKFALKNRY